MPLLGNAALLNWSSVAEADRPGYYAWHAREHMVGRIGVPGFLRGRRYAAVRAGWDFFQFYELRDATVLTSVPYLALANAPSPLTQWATQRIHSSTRVVATMPLSVGAGQGGYLLTLRVEDPGPFDSAMTRELARQIRDLPLVSGVHVFAATSGPERIVFLEGLAPDALEQAGDVLQTKLGVVGTVRRDVFHHEFTVTPEDAVTE
jgi:hypothetical protein